MALVHYETIFQNGSRDIDSVLQVLITTLVYEIAQTLKKSWVQTKANHVFPGRKYLKGRENHRLQVCDIEGRDDHIR
jgi:hypothetical protein